jgi:hypothetical protein
MDNEEVKVIKQELGSNEKMNALSMGGNENYVGGVPDNVDVVFGVKDIWNKIAGKGAKKDDNDKKEEKREIKPVEVDVINTFDENGNPIVLTKAEFELEMSKKEVSMQGCDALWSNEIKRSVILNKMQGGLSEEERKKCKEELEKLKKNDYKITRDDWKNGCPKRFAYCVITECKTLAETINEETNEVKKAMLKIKHFKLCREINLWVNESAENLAVYRKVYEEFDKNLKSFSAKFEVQKDVKSADFDGLNLEKNEKIRKILECKEGEQNNNAPKMKIVAKNEDKLQQDGERKYYADMKILAKEEELKDVGNVEALDKTAFEIVAKGKIKEGDEEKKINPYMKILAKDEDDKKAEVKDNEPTKKKDEVKMDKKVMYEKIKQRA